jgi:hypothetical protein
LTHSASMPASNDTFANPAGRRRITHIIVEQPARSSVSLAFHSEDYNAAPGQPHHGIARDQLIPGSQRRQPGEQILVAAIE